MEYWNIGIMEDWKIGILEYWGENQHQSPVTIH